jgi:hypothetical protein
MRRKVLLAATFAGMSMFGLGLAAPASAAEPADQPVVNEPAVPATVVAKPPTVGVLNVACGYAATDVDGGAWNATAAGANMRSGSSTSCRIYDQADSGDSLDYHCYTSGADGFTWTYVRNESDGTNGWVRDDLLSDNGSFVACTTIV